MTIGSDGYDDLLRSMRAVTKVEAELSRLKKKFLCCLKNVTLAQRNSGLIENDFTV